MSELSIQWREWLYILRAVFLSIQYIESHKLYVICNETTNPRPEVIRGNYNYKADIWSLGVMAYMLLSSQIPFVGRDMSEIAKEIMRGRYSFSGKKWHKISTEGKKFINCLLVKDPAKRPNADQGEHMIYFSFPLFNVNN